MSDSASDTRPYAPRMAREDRREQLLDAALGIVVRDGIHKVSIGTVSKEAGIARPVIYGHFRDSAALVGALLDREEQGVIAQISPIRFGAEALPLAEGVVFYLDQFLAAVREEPMRWRAVLALFDTGSVYRERFEAARTFSIGTFERRVARAMGEEIPSGTDVQVLARMFWAMLWAGGRAMLEDPETFGRERLVAFAQAAIPQLITASSRVDS